MTKTKRDSSKNKKLKKPIQAISSLAFLGLVSYLYVSNPEFFQTENVNKSDFQEKTEKTCRIGMTTNPEQRKQRWKNEYLKEGIEIKKWTILSKHQSRSKAQEVETREAKKQNCVAHPGGSNPKNPNWWYIYKIEW